MCLRCINMYKDLVGKQLLRRALRKLRSKRSDKIKRGYRNFVLSIPCGLCSASCCYRKTGLCGGPVKESVTGLRIMAVLTFWAILIWNWCEIRHVQPWFSLRLYELYTNTICRQTAVFMWSHAERNNRNGRKSPLYYYTERLSVAVWLTWQRFRSM
jgi:hypothetical protein